MKTKNTIRVSHLLFDFLGWVDYNDNQNWPKNEMEKLRSSFISAIWDNDIIELQDFYKRVIRLQQYRYKLNGAAGVETKQWIPKGLEKQFCLLPFDPHAVVTKIPKTIWNQHDPGIILQESLLSEDLQKTLSIKVSRMTDHQFMYFSEMIDALQWFSDFQTQFWFTYHPELIPKGLYHHFWFIDDNYLGEKDFIYHES
jgi:hypothetical protein